MRLFGNEHEWPAVPWRTVVTAVWSKYPSPHTSHILHVDYLSRSLDPVTGILTTERLLTCSQPIPDALMRLIGEEPTSFVYERSAMDPKDEKLTMHSYNLSFSNIVRVRECCQYEGDATGGTRLAQRAKIRLLEGWAFIRQGLEDFCVGRFQANAAKGKTALDQAIDRVLRNDANN